MPRKPNDLEQRIHFLELDDECAKRETNASVEEMSRMQFRETVAPESYD